MNQKFRHNFQVDSWKKPQSRLQPIIQPLFPGAKWMRHKGSSDDVKYEQSCVSTASLRLPGVYKDYFTSTFFLEENKADGMMIN